ncbi:hypothetical protein [Actinomadura atramentaria]|uniref:hypothetical protein n=1 Tax=Actinomadura atramentaria TaxID=1990 RepID=UPI0003750F2C|nr:hypothetical protein [Actinomadura atramentaria]
MHGATLALVTTTVAQQDPNTQGLADWLMGFFGPLFLAGVGIVAIFFLFTREITRFVQFLALAVLVGVIFYTPGVIVVIAKAITTALGVDGGGSGGASPTHSP